MKISFAWLCLLFLFLFSPLAFAGSAGSSSAGDWEYGLGPYNDMYTSGWRQAGTGTRTWDAAADWFTFVWSGGDQIGRIGRNSDSSSTVRNMKIKNVPANCMMTVTAEMKSLNTDVGNWYAFGVYGWTGPNADQHNEFYIDFQASFNSSPGQLNYQSIGSVIVDGVQFDCVKNIGMPWSPSQNQWRAKAVTGPWSGAYKSAPWQGDVSINIKKIFDYWISQGFPGDEYMNDITWAVESYGGCNGSIVMTNIVVPDFNTNFLVHNLMTNLAATPSVITNSASHIVVFSCKAKSSSGTVTNVSLDLTQVGGGLVVKMTNISGATLFRYGYTVPAGLGAGVKTISFTGRDNAGNSDASQNAALTVVDNTPKNYAGMAIYTDPTNRVKGAWSSQRIWKTNDMAAEGVSNYRCDYSLNNYWAGGGLNVCNWTTNAAVDIRGMTNLMLVWNGPASGHTLWVHLIYYYYGGGSGQLTNVNGPAVQLPQTSSWKTTNISMRLLTNSPSNPGAMAHFAELDFDLGGAQTGTGTLRFDNIRFLGVPAGPVPDTTPPTIPGLISPANGYSTTNRSLVLFWSNSTDFQSGVSNYRLVLDGTTNIRPTTSFATGTLSLGVHTWKVAAMDKALNRSAFSGQRSFTILTNSGTPDVTPPTVPGLIFPGTGFATTNRSLVLTWSNSVDLQSGVSNYRLVLDGVTNVLTTSFFTTGTLSFGIHTWTVSSMDKSGNRSAFSTIRAFTIQSNPGSSGSLASQMPGTFMISPNPLILSGLRMNGPLMTVTYNVNADDEVSIEVYTILGELVKQLKGQGSSSSVTWDAKNMDGKVVSSGMYLVFMRVNGKIAGKPVKFGLLR